MTHTGMLQAAFNSQDLDQLIALFDERIVWLGLPQADQSDDAHNHDEEAHDHEHPPMCTSREEVRAVLGEFLASGRTGHPIVLSEDGDSVVVDPRPEPPLAFPLHQAFTFRGDRVVLIQDYPDRAAALADLAPLDQT